MLKAFADDIVCVVRNKNELKNVINEFELLKGDFNIHLNKKKSQFIVGTKLIKESTSEVSGIGRVKEYKYLGLTVTHGKKKLIKMAKDVAEKQVR